MTTQPDIAPDVAAALCILLNNCANGAMECGAASVLIHVTYMHNGQAYRLSRSAGNTFAHAEAHRCWLQGGDEANAQTASDDGAEA